MILSSENMFILWASRLVLGSLFVLAGLAKLHYHEDFAEVLSSFGIKDRELNRQLRKAIPITELTLGMFLMLGFFRSLIALLSIALLLVFSYFIIQALLRGTTADCQCFGKLAKGKLSWLTLIRNLAMLALAVLVFIYQPGIEAVLPLDDQIAQFILSSLITVAVLITAQYLIIRSDFLPVPRPVTESAVEWQWVDRKIADIPRIPIIKRIKRRLGY